jgi:hypothetical protein
MVYFLHLLIKQAIQITFSFTKLTTRQNLFEGQENRIFCDFFLFLKMLKKTYCFGLIKQELVFVTFAFNRYRFSSNKLGKISAC